MQDNLEKPKRVRIFTHNIKKETNMKINETNKQHIHDLMITNMQLRLNKHYEYYGFIDGKSYENALESLVDTILHTNTIADINDVVIEYSELFELLTEDGDNYSEICTLEGTMNYVLNLALEYYTKFKHKSIYRPEFN